MPTVCPKCAGEIPAADINVAKDVAFCRKCDKGFSFSDLVHEGAIPGGVDLANPPQGAWYRDEGGAVRVGASTRSGAGMFFVIFAIFWNSITWFFVSAFLIELIKPGTVPIKNNGHPMPIGFGLLFMIPFVLVGVGTGAAGLVGLFGRVEAMVRGDAGEIFTGVGSIGWRRTFDPAGVTSVSIKPTSWTQNGQRQYAVSLDGAGLKFGSFLTEPRRAFVAAALRKVLG